MDTAGAVPDPRLSDSMQEWNKSKSAPIFARVQEVPIAVELVPRRAVAIQSHRSEGTIARCPMKPENKPISQGAEMRERIKSTLEYYPGIKNKDEAIRAKVEEGRQKIRATESEYWAWNKAMKERVGPSWKMPGDSLAGHAGRGRAEEDIAEKVNKAQKSMAETTSQYKAWVKDMEKKRQEELAEKLQERQKELKNFELRKLEAKMERDSTGRADQEKRAQQAGRYWTWLSDTKNKIEKREVTCAPFTRPTGVKSVEEMTELKRAELAIEVEQQQREYKEWISSIQKPKFTVPHSKCNSVEERDQMIMKKAKESIQKLNQTSSEYTKWVKEVEQQHHERAMERVREKLLADKEFYSNKESAGAALRKKQHDAKRNQQAVVDQNRRAVKEMYERVQSRPLMVEQAYRSAGVALRQAH